MPASQARKKYRAKPKARAIAASQPDLRVVEPEQPQKVSVSIRMATVEDASAIYVMAKHYFDELQSSPVAPFFPPVTPMPTMAWGLMLMNSGAVVVADKGGELVGIIGLEREVFPWAPAVQLFHTVLFYVKPESRAGGTFLHLAKAARDIAAENGLPLRLDYILGIRAEQHDRLRKMMGFTYLGGNFGWMPGGADGQGN